MALISSMISRALDCTPKDRPNIKRLISPYIRSTGKSVVVTAGSSFGYNSSTLRKLRYRQPERKRDQNADEYPVENRPRTARYKSETQRKAFYRTTDRSEGQPHTGIENFICSDNPTPSYTKAGAVVKKRRNTSQQESTITSQLPGLKQKAISVMDHYSHGCHDRILRSIADHSFLRTLPEYNSETLKKRLRHLDTTLFILLDSPTDMNVWMLEFAFATIKYHSERPEHFPIVEWDTVKPALLVVLNQLAGRHGFTPDEYGSFYCGLLVTVNLATGMDENRRFLGPGFDVATTQTLHYKDKAFAFSFWLAWLPTDQETGPDPALEEDQRFDSARVLARRYVKGLKEGQICGITELDFGYLELRAPVLVVFTDPGCIFPDDYFGQPFVHCPDGIAGVSKVTNRKSSSENLPAAQPTESSLPSPSEAANWFYGWLSSIYTEDSRPRAPLEEKLARSMQLTAWKALANHRCDRESINFSNYTENGDKLVHGSSISLKNQFARGSFGLFLESDECKECGTDIFSTAGHVAPHPTSQHWKTCAGQAQPEDSLGTIALVQCPGGFDMALNPIYEMMAAEDRFPWRNLSAAETACHNALAGRKIVGEVLTTDIGGEPVGPNYGWRIDHSLVKVICSDDNRKNGFSHLSERDLLKLAEKVFENFQYFQYEMDPNDAEFEWWMRDDHAGRLRAFGSIAGVDEELRFDGTEKVFKVGATTGLTTGIVNGRRFYLYKKHTIDVDTIIFAVVHTSQLTDETIHFAKEGDCGSAVLRVRRLAPFEWRMFWCGSLVSLGRIPGWRSNLGFMIPAKQQIIQFKESTGYLFRPSP
ncbi:hypothetical protein BJ508DRAFT_380657 [Ascobolus immersus RN42]|uniref:Uncharacterized protein n=1 Tax=Ascobolus immersus RN42 TaxID=1160509 RepID=A0A3N4HKF2_ASCIM|nr:hypothetical protein BJ508DRAFT_380657 [Ascobolus immersus RN42]